MQMAALAAGSGLWARAALFLNEATVSDEENVKLTMAMLAMALASILPSTLLRENVSRNYGTSATLSRLKLYGFLILMVIEVLSLVAWYCLPTFHAAVSPIAAALHFAVASATGLVLDVAAKRRYSWLPSSTFLLLGSAHDFVKFQVYFRNPATHFVSAIMLAACCCRMNLLFVQLLLPRHVPQSVAESATSYISWYEDFSDILKSTLLRGFRNMTDIRSLEQLGPELDHERLAKAFDRNWQKGNKNSQYFLIKVCAQTLSWPAFLGFIPRLFSAAFLFSQVFLLRHILLSGQSQADVVEFRSTIVLSTIVLFFGNSISIALYNYFSHRTHTALRGVLSFQVFRKIDRVGHNQAKSSTALQLIENDIDALCIGSKQMYKYFNDITRLFSGIALLYMLAGPGCLIGIIAAVAVGGVGEVWSRDVVRARSTLERISHQYMSELTNSLRQLQLIKMLGLESVIVEKLRKLQFAESKSWRLMRNKLQKVQSVAWLADSYVSICMGLYLYWSASGAVAEELLLPALMISFHVESTLQQGVQRYSKGPNIFETARRLQIFLLQQERADQRLVEPLGENAIECVGLSVSPQGCMKPLLEGINVSIAKAEVVLAIGPSSSGKSTFLQALAGEADIIEGSIYMEESTVAYCDQIPWLRNISIRDNVVAGLDFEKDRYHVVLGLCLLDYDLQKLEQGDEYIVGVDGMNLSGGQRHRVALARALYSKAPTVILDDVFASLDPKSAISILYSLCGEGGFLRRECRTVIISTYLTESFDVADQSLIFDGRGHVALQDNKNDLSAFRRMLPNLVSPHELNPEEEEHKQLTGILRSHRIRESLVQSTKQVPISRTNQSLHALVLFAKPFNRWLPVILVLINMLICVIEHIPENSTRLWIEFRSKSIRIPILNLLLGLINISVGTIRRSLFDRLVTTQAQENIGGSLLQAVFGSSLAYLGAVDIEYLLDQFNRGLKQATVTLPQCLDGTIYMLFCILFRSATILSGVPGGIYTLPAICAVFYLTYHSYVNVSRGLQKLNTQARESFNQQLRETVDGIRHIRAFGWTGKNSQRTSELLEISQRGFHSDSCLGDWLLLVFELYSCVIIIALVFFATSYKTGIGISFWSHQCITYALSLLPAHLLPLDTALGTLFELERMIEAVPRESNIDGIEVPASWPEQGQIVFQNVTARYRSPKVSPAALHDVSLTINGGEKVGIAGRTASGKSSLLLTLLGFLQYEGRISIDGVDISTVNREELRSRIITLTYEPLQLEGSIRDNLLPFRFQYMPNGDACVDDATLCNVLDSLGIWHLISGRGGLDVLLPTLRLSRAEMQLLGIARAILQQMHVRGRVVLMDEATSALDTTTDSRVQRALRRAFPHCTILVIAHRQITIRDADKFIELSDGRIASIRDVAELEEDDEDEIRVSWDQLAESAGGGILQYAPPE